MASVQLCHPNETKPDEVDLSSPQLISRNDRVSSDRRALPYLMQSNSFNARHAVNSF